MVSNIIKGFIRNLKFNQAYTLINISGLVLGFTVFILSGIFVMHELSYDAHHVNKDRIFRILTDNNNYRNFTKFPVTPAPLGPAMKLEFPEVESFARLTSLKSIRIDFRNNSYFEESWSYTDPDIFKIMSFDFVEGSPANALNSPNSAVLTERMALKIFGTTKVLGEEINLWSSKDLGPFLISGVIQNHPDNSIFGMDIITQFEGTLKLIRPEALDQWNNSNYHTFLLLQPEVNTENLLTKLPFFRDKYTNDKIDTEGNQLSHYLLQPLTDIHYDTEVAFELKPAVSKTNLFIISSIATIILLLAGINYVNLTSAKSINRAKEIGVRKVVGAQKSGLILQFLMESVVISSVAFLMSLCISYLAIPVFSEYLNKELDLRLEFVILLFIVSLLFGLASGAYPSYVLSAFSPSKTLKSKITGSRQSLGFRNTLVVFQFFASSVLIIAAWVINEQLVFIQTKNPGYNKEQILILNWKDRGLDKYRSPLKSEILGLPGIENVTMASHLPNRITQNQTRTWNINGEENMVSFFTGFIDADFIPTLEIELIEGQNISPTESIPQRNYILNETAVKHLGLENPVGMRIIEGKADTVNIIGVIKDFHYSSFHEPIQPVRLCYGNYISKVLVKFNPAHLQEILWNLEQISRKYAPDYQFDYDFLDDEFLKAYENEQNAQTIVNALTTIALIISGLGLFGLITFTINQKFKEIGIRKVFGADRANLIFLLLNKLNLLIVLSFLFSVPVSYLILESWLQNFTFRIDIPLLIYFYSFMVLLIFSWLAVAGQTIKASGLNPTSILRHE